MAYGAEFSNSSGTIQLGTGVTNFRQVASGTYNDPIGIPTINPGGGISFDMVAVRSNNCFPIPVPVFATPRSSVAVPVFGNFGDSFTYHCFRSYRSMAPATSGYGLEIYNDDGTVGFSSREPHIMRTYAKIPITSGEPFDYALPSNRTFAFIAYGKVTKRQYISTDFGGSMEHVSTAPTIQNYPGGVHIGSNYWIDGGDPVADTFNGGILAIDVTGY